MQEKIILTGIKPTGRPHIGNYAGMIRPTLDMISDNSTGQNFLFIANYHALNSINDPALIRMYTYQIAACYMALGMDLKTTSFYRQSDVPEVFELAVILSSVTPKGLMNRAHAYKASVDINNARKSAEPDDGINMGLFTYPVLMAADILLLDATVVPVGKDQIQHVEFTRDIAGYFNRRFDTNFMSMPEHSVQRSIEAIVGLDGRKMSKSYGNTIPLFEDSAKRRKLINQIKTDSMAPADVKDAQKSTVYQLYAALATPSETQQFHNLYISGGMGHGEAKKRLADMMDSMFEKSAARYNDFMSDPGELESMLRRSSDRAREKAVAKIEAVRKIIGT